MQREWLHLEFCGTLTAVITYQRHGLLHTQCVLVHSVAAIRNLTSSIVDAQCATKHTKGQLKSKPKMYQLVNSSALKDMYTQQMVCCVNPTEK
jgi:hypothetical protein